MRKLTYLLASVALLTTPAFAAPNAPSGSPRTQGVPAGYGDPVQVTIRNTDGSAPVAIPVSMASGPLPTDAATATNQASELVLEGAVNETAPASDTASSGLNGRLQRVAQRLTTINTNMGTPLQAGGSIGNTTFAATQSGTWNIGSITTLPALPANQSSNIAQINAVTPLMGNGVTGTGSQRVTIASDNTAFTVNAAQATASSLNAQVVGTIASGSADSGNPVKVGGRFNNTLPTLTDGQRGDLQLDSSGLLRTQLYTSGFVVNGGNLAGDGLSTGSIAVAGQAYRYGFNGTTWDRAPGNTVATSVLPGLSSTFWNYSSGASPILSNTTTAVTIKTAAGASVRNYITSCQITTTAFGTSVPLAIRDGAGGTVIWALAVPLAGFTQPTTVTFSAPLRGTANTLLEIVTTTANTTGTVTANCQGFTGA